MATNKSHYGAQAFLQNGMDFQRTYHFEVSFTWKASNTDAKAEEIILPTFAAQSVSLPKYTNQGQDTSYGNASIKLPGTINWDEVNIVFVDAFDANGMSISEYLHSWFNETVYDMKNDRAGMYHPDNQNNFMSTSQPGRPHSVIINEFFPDGQVAKTWTLFGAWIVNIDFGQLDYSQNDKKTVNISVAFSAMDLTGYRRQKAGDSQGSVKTGGTGASGSNVPGANSDGSWGEDMIQSAGQIASSAFSGLPAIIPSFDQIQSTLASQLQETFSKAAGKVLQPLTDVFQKVTGGLGGVMGGNLGSILPSDMGSALGGGGNPVQTITSKVQGSVNKILGGFSGGKFGLPNFFGS